MTNIAIKVENLSKQYRLGTVGTGTIIHDLNRWWAQVRGKEDPFLKIGETNDRSKAGNSDYVWSLKNINFEVKQGEVLGIIGKNGAGKSTLLKILSKVTGPTTGRISAKGRIGALLEVGTGFHPELTGRENIFLNGALLGMTKAEIKVKLDEIIDFSGCARYIDTPVKRYSSGMKVRLAFAVAAFLEPEILIIDEVLAVGDAEFQKKAIGKMQDVSKGEGRTVLFVSHNMTAVSNLCNSALLLENGTINSSGSTDDIISKYLTTKLSDQVNNLDGISNNGVLRVDSISVNREDIYIDEEFSLQVKLTVLRKVDNKHHVNLFFTDGGENTLFVISSLAQYFEQGSFIIDFAIPSNFLNDRVYAINLMLIEDGARAVLKMQDAFVFEPKESRRGLGWMGRYPGFLRPTLINSTTTRINE
ncbi:ABC transporter ATP-binding protein [uncultured Roseivirga sp.]|uniref:ABC transporter ATP-binding protein n=1 Tax=uncultured Roseivirga sp. TaxID=543088 RepID=UPI000D7A6AC7|nr:ABC transporter ATP-binding protein [uncultured Roseivirga sp.]PWL27231.1 MAG: ABC transporter [Roseivirga sp. XM-24bin3]